MYTATVDGLTLYNPASGFPLESAKLSMELNKVGAFDFTIRPDHPAYDHIHQLSSRFEVRDRSQIVMRGRVLNVEEGFHNELSVSCESDLAYLLDSVQRPYDYAGTLSGLFTQYIANHNAQVDESRRFTVGNITVTDSNDYVAYSSTQYPNTWDEINEKLIGTHGGYLQVRYSGGTAYIDYLADFDVLANQAVEFGRNMLDYARKSSADDVITAVIPLGAENEETGQRVTIESVNGGVDYVYDQEAAAAYGLIYECAEWDDVTLPENLKTKAEAYLDERVLTSVELELSAVDLAALDTSIGAFHLGTYVKVDSPPHGVSGNLLVSKLSIDMNSPSATTLSLGAVAKTFTGIVQDQRPNVNEIVSDYVNSANVQLNKVISSVMEQTEKNILFQVSEDYFLKEDADALAQSIGTQFEQTNTAFEFQFNQFSADLEALQNGVDGQFTDISKYIRFEDGDIILGQIGNELTLRIANNRISFLQSNVEVAYISNNKLYITDAQVLNRLDIGNFAFRPRDNGNLTLAFIG